MPYTLETAQWVALEYRNKCGNTGLGNKIKVINF